MKANKALKRLAKIEALMSDLTERYSARAPLIRELLQVAKAAVTRAKEAVSLRTSSGTARNPAVKHSTPASKATPEPSKPKRKLSAAGRKAIVAATARQEGIVSTMDEILKQMAQWDSFVDVLNQLNEIIRLEQQVHQTTEQIDKSRKEKVFDP